MAEMYSMLAVALPANRHVRVEGVTMLSSDLQKKAAALTSQSSK